MGALIVNLKYISIGALTIIAALFYFINESNKEDRERIKQAEIAHQQRLEQNKLDAINAEKVAETERIKIEKAKALKAEQDKINMQKQAKEFEQAQQTKETEDIKFIEDKARKGLFDPEAAKFRNIKGNCGEINAKNKVGGYTGYRRFIYDAEFDTVSIEDEKDGLYNPKMMDILWEKKCP